MNQKRPASAGASRRTFAPEPVLFCPNFSRKPTIEIPKDLSTSDESVIKYNSRPSSASCVNRIFKKDNSKPSKEIDKTKCFLRISTSPLPYARSPSPSMKLGNKTTTPSSSSRPNSATTNSRSAISIAKSSNTFKFGLTNENFRELIEKNMVEQKKGRPPFPKTFTTQLGEESDHDDDNIGSREDFCGNSKQEKNLRPRSAAPLSSRPWSASTSSSTYRYAKKSRVTETPRFSGRVEMPPSTTTATTTTTASTKFSKVTQLTSPHGLSHVSLPNSETIEVKVASTPKKYTNLKLTTPQQQYGSSSSFESSTISLKKSCSSSSVKNNNSSSSNRITPEGNTSDSGSDYELDIKPYELDINELVTLSIPLPNKKSEEQPLFSHKQKPVLSRTGSTIINTTPSNNTTNLNTSSTIEFNEKTQPTKTTTGTPLSHSKPSTPSSSSTNNHSRRLGSFQSPNNPLPESFGLGEEYEAALMDSAAILKNHILAIPKTKNQLQRSASNKKMTLHSSPQVRNDFLLSRNKFATTSFARAAQIQNKAYTNLGKADKHRTNQTGGEEEQEAITSIQIMEKDIVYTTATDRSITFQDEDNLHINLDVPLIDTKGEADKKHKEKPTESNQFSLLTKSMNQVVEIWGSNIQNSKEKDEYDSIINDTQAIEKMASLKHSVETINGYGSKAAMKIAKKTSDEISMYIIEKNPSFFGFEVSKTFLEDFSYKKKVETEDDVINIIKNYKQDITETKTHSSDSEEDTPHAKKEVEHRPLTLGKEKRRKINQKILDERIAEIKKYSWKYAELDNRVKEIKQEIKEKERKLNIQDHIRLNTTKQSFESIQAKKEFIKEKFSDRRERALVTFQEQEKKRHEILEAKFEEKEKKRQNASSEKMSKLYKQQLWKLQKTWFPIIKLSLFITQLSEPMLHARQVRKHNADVEWAHSVMKKRLIPYILNRREERQRTALEIIRKNWLIYVINFRVRRRKRAVHLIEEFIRDINKTSTIVKAVSRFMTSVKKIQKFIKHFLFKRRIHLYILNEQYKRCERDLVKSTAKEDLQEVRFKIVDVLKKMKETAFFEEPTTATETRAIQRKQNTTSSAHNNSGLSDDTSGVRRTKLAVTEAKKNLKAIQKFITDELKEVSKASEAKISSPRGRRPSTLPPSADIILKGSDKWNKGLDDFPYIIHIIENGSLRNDLLLKVGRILRISPRIRSTKTEDIIRMKIVREDLSRRMNKILVEEAENEKRKERNVIALNEQNKKFTEIQKRPILNSVGISNQILAKQIDIIEEDEEIDRAQQELEKKKSLTFVPPFYMENLVRRGLDLTLRNEAGSPFITTTETPKSPKKKSNKGRSRRASMIKDSLAEERENDFQEYEKLLQDLQ